MSEQQHGLAIRGVRLGVAAAGIKKPGRNDLLVIELAAGGTAAAVFTRNAFCAAPVTVAREHLASAPRWLLINSGNANAGTGRRGIDDAGRCCAALAGMVGATPEQVLPFSTGVIGEYLPVDRIERALPAACSALDEGAWPLAAQAIMTTDTRPKCVSRVLDIDGRPVTLTGIAKGAGMIQPNMATMLAFIATDATLRQGDLQQVLVEVADQTFNCITVDGDTSTNDACVLLASGQAGVPALERDSESFRLFRAALLEVSAELAEQIVRDGEGATKLLRILVEGARNDAEAREVGKTIAHSPLVKTAFFASDPNWGRILAAVGRAPCVDLDIAHVDIWLDEVAIVVGGERAAQYREEDGQRVMNRNEILVRVALGRGNASQTVLSCDLSYDYVRINAEYRT